MKKYLLESFLDAHCLNCKRGWNDEFMDLNFTRAFRTGAWRKHRQDVLLDREMSLLPTRQPLVIAHAEHKKAIQELKDIHDEIQRLKLEIRKIETKRYSVEKRRVRYEAEKEGKEPPEWSLPSNERGVVKEDFRSKFIMRCPDSECRGFLSTAYKCGTCQKYACPECLVMKGEKHADHTCNEEDRKSVAEILKKSKPCPNCGERIIRSEGCAQMFCTECKTAFDWNSGKIIKGHIHNPHYQEFIQKHGDQHLAQLDNGNIGCGGLPNYTHLERALQGLPQRRLVDTIHRRLLEVMDYEIRRFTPQTGENANADLGLKYLLKEVEKEDMKKELAKRETKTTRQLAIRAVLEMFVNVGGTLLTRFIMEPREHGATPGTEKTYWKENSNQLNTLMLEIEALRSYVNKSLLNISRMKGCVVPQMEALRTDGHLWDEDGNLLHIHQWHWNPSVRASSEGKIKEKVKAKTKGKKQVSVAAGGGASYDSEDSSVESYDSDYSEG